MEYILGYGYFGKAISDCLKRRGVDHVFIDTFYEGEEVAQGIVLRPDTVTPSPTDRLWLAAMPQPTTATNAKKTSVFAKSLGFHHVLELAAISQELPEVWRGFVSDGFMWRKATAGSLAPLWEAEKCTLVKSHLLDADSHQLYDRLKSFRQNPVWDSYPIPQIGLQYAELGALTDHVFSEQIDMLDIGAFDGDTLQEFHEFFGPRLASYMAIEPIPAHEAKIATRIEAINAERAQAHMPQLHHHVIGAATGSKPGRIGFQLAGSASAQVTHLTETMVDVVRIDDVIEDRPINFIKIDVEGAEGPTLEGAKSLIREQRPNLAIASYHKPSDIWEIPLWFLENFDGPQFSFRQHHHWGLELVLYVTWQS